MGMCPKCKKLEKRVEDLEIVFKYKYSNQPKRVPLKILAEALRNGEKLAKAYDGVFTGSLLEGPSSFLEKRGLVPVVRPLTKKHAKLAVDGWLIGEPVYY